MSPAPTLPLVRSIRGRLILVVAAVLVPAILLAAWLIAQDYRNQRLATERHLRESARALSLLLDAALREREGILRALANSWQFHARDYAAFRTLAESVMARRPGWVIVMDATGRQRVNTSRAPGAELPTVAIAPEESAAIAAGRLYFSNFSIGAASRKPLLYVSMPVGSGPDAHVLVMTVPAETLANILLENRIAERWLVALVDRDFRIAARSRTPERYLGHPASEEMQDILRASPEGLAETVSLDGVPSITAFNRSAMTGWTVIIAAPREQVFASAIAMMRVALTAAALSALAAMVIAAWAVRAVIDAVQTLVSETEALGRGEVLRARRTGIHEIDYVSDALVATSRELAERQVALERARDSAVAASRAKDEFLAALSHELRTPLSPVLLLATDAAADSRHSPAARAVFATIAKQVMLEARLIDDLLDLTRITRGKMLLDRRPVDLHAVVRDAVTTVRAEIDERRHLLHLQLEAPRSIVAGDATRLQQVFCNLLNNAIKFTPAAGTITVRSRMLDQEIEVSVADTGIGISPEEARRIFAPFVQGDHASSPKIHRFGGLGLGLAISRRLVESHAGRLAVESAGRGAGSVFTVTLPLSSEQLPESLTPPAIVQWPEPVRSRGESVLLVEDHDSTRVALVALLERRGYRVVAAASVAEAQRAADEQRFAFVISDIGLPDGDGYGLMVALRDRHGLRGVALSGYGMEEDIERGRAAGFVAYLTKPVNVRALEEALASLAAA